MSNDQINAAIAEACGWTVIADTLCNVIPDRKGDPCLEPIAPLPNYHRSLDAMALAEATLNDEDFQYYEEHLLDVLTEKLPIQDIGGLKFPRGRVREISAKAEDRAEAFFRFKKLKV